MTAVEIMIADDVKEWRLQLRSLLELIPGLHVVAEAADGLKAVEQAAQFHPDVVLLDIGMPLLNGIDAAMRIQSASPQTKIIFLTQEDDSDIRDSALATGAAGYLLKTTPACELQHMIGKLLMSKSCATDSRLPAALCNS